MKTITQSIQSGISRAYISLLMDATDLFTHPGVYNIEVVDQDLYIIIHQMKEQVSTLNTIIGSDESFRNEMVVSLSSYHKILEDKFKIINAYNRELSHIATSLESDYHLKTAKKEDIEGINYHQFIHEGLDFIAKAKDEEDRSYKISEIIRLLPMRMTKNSFITYIQKSLERISPSPLDTDSSLFLSVFKQIFDGRLVPSYGQVFTDISIAIEDFRVQSKENLTPSRIEEIFDDIFLLQDTTQELYDMIACLHRMISSLSTLLILDTLDFDTLCNEHVSFKDLFFTVKSFIKGDTHGEDYTLIVETLPDRLEDVFHEINEHYEKSFEQFYRELEKDSFPKTEETFKLIKVLSLIKFYALLDVEDAFLFKTSKDKSAQLPASIIASALDFLTQKLKSLEAGERKLRMQYLMSMLPFVMDTQSFANYFDRAIEGTSNDIQKAYILVKITSFMESFGYFDLPDSHDH